MQARATALRARSEGRAEVTGALRPGVLAHRPVVFSTDDFAPGDRFDAYRELYAQGADVEALGPDPCGRLRSFVLGSVVLHERHLRSLRHSRGEGRVRRDAFDHFTLQLVHAGRLQIEAGDVRLEVGPGELAVLDMTQPFSTRCEASCSTVSAPRSLMREVYPQCARLHGLKLGVSEAEPLFAWRGQALAAGHRPGDFQAETTLTRALAAALPSRTAKPRPSRRDWEATRLERVLEMIEQHLDADGLTPEEIASETGMSRATLYRVFEPLGSIARWRQARRLWRFKHTLACDDLPVAEAADAVGLTDPAYAAALFGRTYGSTPSAFRREVAGGLASDPQASARWLLANIPVVLLAAND